MGSPTKQLVTVRKRRDRHQNRKRKNKVGKHSTLSAAELFAGCGEPQGDKPQG
jgi:hypothetical protein